MVQHARWTPGVAEIFERHESGAKFFCPWPMLLHTFIEQQAARARRDAPGTGGEARQAKIAHVNNSWPFSHAADDALSVDAAEQAFEIWVAVWIVQHHCVFDGSRHA